MSEVLEVLRNILIILVQAVTLGLMIKKEKNAQNKRHS